ncbi:MAG: transglutaminase domain-containing protein, partial [Methanobrevibacter sp.]|nr:transglutaminase domain-containing protein [Methanobrevibacter sp.]
IKMNMSSFAYLMSKSLDNLNKGKTSDVALVDVSSTYKNMGNSSVNADLNKNKYIELSNILTDFIEEKGRLPYYITTDIGQMSPNLYMYGLSKALDFYSNMNRLPNYVTFDAKDVEGGSSITKKGNASQYKKGLNEVQALNSTEIAKYLKSSGNDALNAAIKELANNLTKGKTTVWAKAEAIFNWVRDNVQYEYYANTKYKATGTLSKKRGNCCDHANLIVALCRAADIPARYSHGKNCKFSSGLNTGHVWAQIYVDGVWYSADATSSRNKLGNIQNWNTNSFTLQEYAMVHLTF